MEKVMSGEKFYLSLAVLDKFGEKLKKIGGAEWIYHEEEARSQFEILTTEADLLLQI
jgi:hypothetical protein